MAEQTTRIPVMIASPGDVNAERDVIRRVLGEWNEINTGTLKVWFDAIGWDSHGAPEYGDERGQSILNRRVLKDCDLLVAVFWKRLGTPTPEAESGTIEELERHFKSGKPAMLYFRTPPTDGDGVDPVELERVKKFQEHCRSQERGLDGNFTDPEDLEKKFRRHLQIRIHQDDHLRSLFPDAPHVGQPATSAQPLTQEAITLLRAAAEDRRGQIVRFATFTVDQLQAGDHRFDMKPPRQAAKIEHALDQLVSSGYLAKLGSNGQCFVLTQLGWEFLDSLEETSETNC
jgi:hypothetical protein